MAFSVSDTVSSAQADLEKLVTDVRGLLASKDLDSIPQIHCHFEFAFPYFVCVY